MAAPPGEEAAGAAAAGAGTGDPAQLGFWDGGFWNGGSRPLLLNFARMRLGLASAWAFLAAGATLGLRPCLEVLEGLVAPVRAASCTSDLPWDDVVWFWRLLLGPWAVIDLCASASLMIDCLRVQPCQLGAWLRYDKWALCVGGAVGVTLLVLHILVNFICVTIGQWDERCWIALGLMIMGFSVYGQWEIRRFQELMASSPLPLVGASEPPPPYSPSDTGGAPPAPLPCPLEPPPPYSPPAPVAGSAHHSPLAAASEEPSTRPQSSPAERETESNQVDLPLDSHTARCTLESSSHEDPPPEYCSTLASGEPAGSLDGIRSEPSRNQIESDLCSVVVKPERPVHLEASDCRPPVLLESGLNCHPLSEAGENQTRTAPSSPQGPSQSESPRT